MECCQKQGLLDIIQNFVCFNDTSEKIVKILGAYHQYFAVKKAVVRAQDAVAGDGKIGVFWHTQGSGKSLSMVFFAHLIQKYLESPTIVVITDRNDLMTSCSVSSPDVRSSCASGGAG